jgi:hypothetical protein
MKGAGAILGFIASSAYLVCAAGWTVFGVCVATAIVVALVTS